MDTEPVKIPTYPISITIVPPVSYPAKSFEKGDSVDFSATLKYVGGTGTPPQTVTWSVSGNSSSNTRFSGKTLIIDLNESASDITVRATSTEYKSYYATMNISLFRVSLVQIDTLKDTLRLGDKVKIDNVMWIFIKHENSGIRKCALLVREEPVSAADPLDISGSYSGSKLQDRFKAMSDSVSILTPSLAKNAIMPDLGNDTYSTSNSHLSNKSRPSTIMAANVAGTGREIFFPLSRAEANELGGGTALLYIKDTDWWLRTPTQMTWHYVESKPVNSVNVGTIKAITDYSAIVTSKLKFRPAVWVRYL